MTYLLLKTVHVLCIIVWMGGMVFAHFFLRPAATQLEPPVRLRLLHDVLGRFFRALLAATLLTLGTGVWMIGRVARQAVQSGGSFQLPAYWTVMVVLGILMVAIFMYVRFALYRQLTRAVQASDWPAGGVAMAQIRLWVAVNLGLGAAILLATMLRWPA